MKLLSPHTTKIVKDNLAMHNFTIDHEDELDPHSYVEAVRGYFGDAVATQVHKEISNELCLQVLTTHDAALEDDTRSFWEHYLDYDDAWIHEFMLTFQCIAAWTATQPTIEEDTDEDA